METKHTKKDWSVQVNETNNQEIFVKTNLAAICRVYDNNSQIRNYEEALANAKLIAAAPELLEALIEIRKTIGAFINIQSLPEQDLKRIDLVKNAIKKATE